MDSPEEIKPQFPLYIPSKGRFDCALTPRVLNEMGIKPNIIVEEHEIDKYKKNFPFAEILELPVQYKKEYDTCDDLGLSKSTGPGPARNFAWDDSIEKGFAWHWVMDDNIQSFDEWNKGKRTKIVDPSIFRKMEDFCLKFENISMAGPCYTMFAFREDMTKMKPFILNTRIYSCNLIRNNVPFRWRGRYNEDTILSLDMLTKGWYTVQFYAFLQRKINTQIMKGGNSDEFYFKEGTLNKSKMQVEQYPEYSRLVKKYGRWHHHVNYNKFKHKLIKR